MSQFSQKNPAAYADLLFFGPYCCIWPIDKAPPIVNNKTPAAGELYMPCIIMGRFPPAALSTRLFYFINKSTPAPRSRRTFHACQYTFSV